MDYRITLEQITALADALAACDGHVRAGSPDKHKVHAAHGVLIDVLGQDEAQMYGMDELPEAHTPIADAVRKAVARDNQYSADDYWNQEMPEGALRDAVETNRYLENRHAVRDYNTMSMCTRYGNLNKVTA